MTTMAPCTFRLADVNDATAVHMMLREFAAHLGLNDAVSCSTEMIRDNLINKPIAKAYLMVKDGPSAGDYLPTPDAARLL